LGKLLYIATTIVHESEDTECLFEKGEMEIAKCVDFIVSGA